MLAMGRALMAQPKVLLLDEPSMGLSPIMVDKIFEVVARSTARASTILLVEQNASRALQLADPRLRDGTGEMTMSGDAKSLLERPEGARRLPRRVTQEVLNHARAPPDLRTLQRRAAARFAEARICSFECTFCASCADEVLADVCPNCGGGFAARPIRPARNWKDGNYLGVYPAGTKVRHRRSTPRRTPASRQSATGCPPQRR